MSGQYSRTDTLQPNEFSIDAISRPMTPAPMTQTLFGNCSSESISFEVITPGSSAPGIGRDADTEPVATMM